MAVILNEESKPSLLEATADAELIAPSTLPWEVGNALSALFKRKRIDLDQAKAALASYSQIAVRLTDVDVDSSVQLAYEQAIYAYDAYILECARRYRTPLLTLDGPLRIVAKKIDVKVMEIEA
jgi:predicted nucleic acid-binding protein